VPLTLLPLLKAQVAQTAQRLFEMGWVANHDGNVSVRLTSERLLITPTAVSKRDVDVDGLIVVDFDGRVIEGRRKPFSELELHVAAYRARPDIDCVVHAHPPHCTAFGLVGRALEPIALPEMVVSLGDSVPTLPRAMPRSEAGRAAVATAASRVDAMLLAGNGALTLGKDLEQALLRMELLEHYAKILHIASALGSVAPLAPEQRSALLEARAKAGLGPPAKA
jgi:L-fuculose-phosphate aldolase